MATPLAPTRVQVEAYSEELRSGAHGNSQILTDENRRMPKEFFKITSKDQREKKLIRNTLGWWLSLVIDQAEYVLPLLLVYTAMFKLATALLKLVLNC
jgi:hypothetical protein